MRWQDAADWWGELATRELPEVLRGRLLGVSSAMAEAMFLRRAAVPANLTLVGERAEAFKAAADLLREVGPEYDDDELAFEARLGEELFAFDWYAGGGFDEHPVLLCWRRGTERVVFASVEHVRALTPAAAELLEALR